jgi:hypothetical protein
LRREGKFKSAREKLLVCVAESCPGIVREDCLQRMEELDRLTPSVVFEAKDSKGQDLTEVRVTMDGAPLLPKLGAGSVPVDPGEHEFTFEMDGEPSVTRRIVLREGDKARREVVVLGEGKKKAAATLAVVAGPNDEVTLDGTVMGIGRWSGEVTPGPHEVKVTGAGKKPYIANVDLAPDGNRTLPVTLEDEKKALLPTWLWVTAGVVAAGGLTLGGYFLFRPSEEPGARPIGKMASGTLSFGFGR